MDNTSNLLKITLLVEGRADIHIQYLAPRAHSIFCCCHHHKSNTERHTTGWMEGESKHKHVR